MLRLTNVAHAAAIGIGLLAFCGTAAALPVYTNTVSIPLDAGAPDGNFGAPSAGNNVVAYQVLTGQDSTYLYVKVVSADPTASAAVNFSNIYLGGGTSVGIEVTNNRAFRPGFVGYYDLTGTGYSYSSMLGEIAFALPWSFLTDDPLNMGFTPLSDVNNFTRVSLSQSFGYTVVGGSANFGNDRLGAFTLPTDVPEPASLALLGLAVAGLAGMRRRASAA